jgi:hypothetical protein
VDYGVAPQHAAALDREDVPRLILPIDSDGLPNHDRTTEAAVALVGDSFMVFGSQRRPPGLQAYLEEHLTPSIINVGVSGIGPAQELYLLERVALPQNPRLVLWFFFGGNDLIDAFWLQVHIAQGNRTLGDLFRDRRAPRFYLPSLFLELLRPAPRPRASEVLPGFRWGDSPNRTLWLYPDTLRSMVLKTADLKDNPGWHAITDVLGAARRACDQARSRLLVVYLPSKEQVMLPRVQPDGELLQRYIRSSTLFGLPFPADPEELLATILKNRGTLEMALEEHCKSAGIAYWSATPIFEAHADRGSNPFYVADSHWRSEVQVEVAEAMVRALERLGLWSK